MPFRIKVFKSAKQGRPITECADAYDIASHEGIPTGVIALADGATEALLSGDFANEICRKFIQMPEPPFDAASLTAWAEPLAAEFQAQLLKWAYGMQEKADANWVFPMKAEDEGSFSTFLAVYLMEPEGDAEAYWKAVAVGDCCISRWRDGKLQQASWPIETPEQFGTTPGGISSRLVISGQVVTGPDADGPGQWRRGDLLCMATDAVADWLIRYGEQADLAEWFDWSYEDYHRWLEGERNATPWRIKDDDSTLILVQWAETAQILKAEQPGPEVEEIPATSQEIAPAEEVTSAPDAPIETTEETMKDDSSSSPAVNSVLPAEDQDDGRQGSGRDDSTHDPESDDSATAPAGKDVALPTAAPPEDSAADLHHPATNVPNVVGNAAEPEPTRVEVVTKPAENIAPFVCPPSTTPTAAPLDLTNSPTKQNPPVEDTLASATSARQDIAAHQGPTLSQMILPGDAETFPYARHFKLIEQCLLLPWPISVLWYYIKKKTLQPDR